MFFDFPSAFNTIEPLLLREKLQRMQVFASSNFPTDRSQFVLLQGSVSEQVLTSTGAPQGTILLLLLFTCSHLTFKTILILAAAEIIVWLKMHQGCLQQETKQTVSWESFNACSKLLDIFYQSVVACAIFYAASCRCSRHKQTDQKGLFSFTTCWSPSAWQSFSSTVTKSAILPASYHPPI